jgi:hypothetical protein
MAPKIQNTGTSQKRRIFLRVWEPEDDDPEGRTDYYARIGRLEIEGWLYGADRDDVKKFLKRVLKAEVPLSEQIENAVNSVVSYLVAGVQLGLTMVAAAGGVDYNEREGLTFKVEMFYDDDRWYVEVRAVHVRLSGRHVLTKRATLKHVTAEGLRKIVAKVVRIAYNTKF